MVILLTEDAERMPITVERPSAMGCTYRFDIILRKFYKKCIQFWATKEACLSYVPSFAVTVGSPSRGCLLKLHSTFRKNFVECQTQGKDQLTPSKHL
jgi:hypothetical protein